MAAVALSITPPIFGESSNGCQVVWFGNVLSAGVEGAELLARRMGAVVRSRCGLSRATGEGFRPGGGANGTELSPNLCSGGNSARGGFPIPTFGNRNWRMLKPES